MAFFHAVHGIYSQAWRKANSINLADCPREGRPCLSPAETGEFKMTAYFRKKESTIKQLLPLAILLLGAFLRLWALGQVPGGMHQDEAFVAWNAHAILKEGMDSAGHHFPVYMADWGDGHSALYVWLLIPILTLFGGHITPVLSPWPLY